MVGTHAAVAVWQNDKFTGKERDAESGLDNFGARYDSSTLGRFMTPDWAARPTTVPYAVFGDPQSLNLYGYVRNDPVSRADADGHFGVGDYSSPVTGIQLFNEGSQVNGDPEEAEALQQEGEGKALAQAQDLIQMAANSPDLDHGRPHYISEDLVPPDVQQDIKEGTPPAANMVSCPNCKYYPKDVQEAVKTHERQHMKQMVGMGLGVAAACSAVKSCHRAMELDAYRAESQFVNKRLSELKAEEAKGPLSTTDQVSKRVLTEMKTQEDNFFKYPNLLDDK
ncbi:MAG: RHS repeat-associated core domain-containing protein [Terriglobales bacterium]